MHALELIREKGSGRTIWLPNGAGTQETLRILPELVVSALLKSDVATSLRIQSNKRVMIIFKGSDRLIYPRVMCPEK